MKSTIMFKDTHPTGLMSSGRARKGCPPSAGANDNFRSLEFETEGQERDWRLLCLIASIVCGLTLFVFLPLW